MGKDQRHESTLAGFNDVVKNLDFTGSGTGVEIAGSQDSVSGCDISGSSENGVLVDASASDASVAYSAIGNNGHDGVLCFGNNFDVYESTIGGNGYAGVELAGSDNIVANDMIGVSHGYRNGPERQHLRNLRGGTGPLTEPARPCRATTPASP